jgi:hypothetical protein
MLPCNEYKKKELQKEALYLDHPHTDVQVKAYGGGVDARFNAASGTGAEGESRILCLRGTREARP